MKRINSIGSVRGFTLVEVLVAMGIFAFGSMALLALQVHSIKMSALARKLSFATELAQYPIESWKATTFSDFEALRRKIDPANSVIYETTTSCTFADPASSSDDKPFVAQQICTDWRNLFYDAEKSNQFAQLGKGGILGKGTMKIFILKPPGDFTRYADVSVKVEWCDDTTLDKCDERRKHMVEASERFTNKF